MKTKQLIAFGVVMVAIVAVATFLMPERKPASSQKPIVSLSTYTLYEIAHTVAGESLDIRSIIPPGSDAHMFAPDPKQVAAIAGSALFVYNGAGFETWAEPFKKSLPVSVRIVDMSGYVHLLHEKEGCETEHGHDHHHGEIDPHYWLDIDNMIIMTRVIESEFSRLTPENAARYKSAAQSYIARLEQLKSDYAARLHECKNRTLVSNHDAFGYLTHANSLEDISVIGLSSDEQPSAHVIAKIIALVKEHGIKTIFFETMINDNVAQTIAKESGAQAQSLHPLENISQDELKSHQNYESIMRDNLAKLTKAMECR